MTQDTFDFNKSVSELSISELVHEVALLTYRVEFIRRSGQTNSGETIRKYLSRVREIEAEAYRRDEIHTSRLDEQLIEDEDTYHRQISVNSR